MARSLRIAAALVLACGSNFAVPCPSVAHATWPRSVRPAATPGAAMRSRRPVAGDTTARPLPRAWSPAGVRFAAGVAHAAVLDPLASPLRYSGGGAALSLAYTRRSTRTSLELSLETAFPRLGSSLTLDGNGPREAATFAALQGVWLRTVSGAPATGAGQLLLGAGARIEGSVRDHRYAEPALHFFYGLAVASAGPAAGWRRAWRGAGEVRAVVAAPLLGLAYRPYCDLAYARTGVRLRAAAPPTLAGVDAALGWSMPLGRTGVGLAAEWRLDYLRYRDHELYRAARQRLDLGLVLAPAAR